MQVIAFMKAAVARNDSTAVETGGPPTAGGVHKTNIPPQGPACVLPPSKVSIMPRDSSLTLSETQLSGTERPPTAGRADGTGASLHGAASPTDHFARTAAEERLNSQLPLPWPPGQGPDTRKGATHFSDNRELPLSIPEARHLIQECFGKHTGDPEYRYPQPPHFDNAILRPHTRARLSLSHTRLPHKREQALCLKG